MVKSVVCLWDMSRGECIKEAFYDLPVKAALIAAVNQYKGNYNTWEYGNDLPGIYKSHVIKDRLIFDITENLVIYSQNA